MLLNNESSYKFSFIGNVCSWKLFWGLWEMPLNCFKFFVYSQNFFDNLLITTDFDNNGIEPSVGNLLYGSS